MRAFSCGTVVARAPAVAAYPGANGKFRTFAALHPYNAAAAPVQGLLLNIVIVSAAAITVDPSGLKLCPRPKLWFANEVLLDSNTVVHFKVRVNLQALHVYLSVHLHVI